MKKIMIFLVLIIAFSFQASAFAASQKQIDDLNTKIKQQQEIYDVNVKLASEYLDKIISGRLSFFEKVEYRIKLQTARKKYNDAAAKMLELKKELYELTHS